MAVLFFVDQPGLEICLAETHRLRGAQKNLIYHRSKPLFLIILW